MTTSVDNKDIKNNLRVVGLAVLGIVVFGIHILVFYLNQYMFNVLVCLYVILYSITIFVAIAKNKDCYNKPMFNILVNFSLYTIVLQAFLLIFTLIMYSVKSANKPTY